MPNRVLRAVTRFQASDLIWNDPDHALTVVLERSASKTINKVIDRLQAGDSRIQQEAGLLLGSRITKSGGEVITVQRFLLLHDSRLLEAALSNHQPTANPREYVVGYCRIRAGGPAEVEVADEKLFTKYFPYTSNVLLVATRMQEETVANLFFRANGTLLRCGSTAYLPVEAEDEKAVLPHPGPIASPSVPLMELSDWAPQTPPTPPAAKSPQSSLLLYGAVFATLIAGGLVWSNLNRLTNRLDSAARSASPSDQSSFPIQLSVQRQEADLQISWDRQLALAPGIIQANLSITDGVLTNLFPLDISQIRSGHVLYRPTSNNVDIRLLVETAGGKHLTESVRVIGSEASLLNLDHDRSSMERLRSYAPLNSVASAEREQLQRIPTPVTTIPPPAVKTAAVPDQPETPGIEAVPLPAPKLPVTLTSRLRFPEALPLPQREPSAVAQKEPSPLPQPEAPAQQGSSQPQVTKTPVPVPQMEPPARNFQRAVLTRHSPITIPPMLRRLMIKEADIELTAVLDQNGKVVGTRVPKEKGLRGVLAETARAAVLQYRFKPARMNGNVVGSELPIRIHFQPQPQGQVRVTVRY